jgi:hypothetical protein
VPAPLTAPIGQVCGDSHEQLLGRLIELARDVGYLVQLCDTGRSDGRCDHGRKRIAIAERLEPNARVATLIHELGHALVRTELGDRHADTLDYAAEELAVESIAFCCCQTVGLDTSANSIPYLASWAERAPLEVLERTAELTGRIADRIDATLLADSASGENAEGPRWTRTLRPALQGIWPGGEPGLDDPVDVAHAVSFGELEQRLDRRLHARAWERRDRRERQLRLGEREPVLQGQSCAPAGACPVKVGGFAVKQRQHDRECVVEPDARELGGDHADLLAADSGVGDRAAQAHHR